LETVDEEEEERVDEKKDASEVDWRKLRTALKKAGDCAPQALATANLAPLPVSLFPLLPLLTLLLLFANNNMRGQTTS